MRKRRWGFSVVFLLMAIVSLVAVNHSGTIGTETWVGGYTHYILDTVTVPDGETLTIEAGATVAFSINKSLVINGRLIADGTSLGEITFTSGLPDPQAGDWDQVQFIECDPGTTLDHCVFEYGGSGTSMVFIHNCGENISFSNSSFSHATGSGVYMWDQSTSPSEPSFSNCSFNSNSNYGLESGTSLSLPYIYNCSFSNNTMYGASVFANGLDRVSGTIGMAGNGYNVILVSGNSIGTGTWNNVGVPFYMHGNVTIPDGNTLTIQAGCDLRFTGGYYIIVYGTMIADGTPGDHITFTTASGAIWNSIQFIDSDPGSVLDYCDLSYGGSAGSIIYFTNNNSGVTISNCTITNSHSSGIYLYDYSATPSSPTITNTTIENCNGYGIDCSSGTSLPWISDCTFNNNSEYAMSIFATGYDRLSGNITGTGNGTQGILVLSGAIGTGTWLAFDLPFFMHGASTIPDGNTLTVEPGTQFKFTVGASLKIEGALIANGTESEHIVFTSASATPAPGDWNYLFFYRTDAGTSLSWCDILYSGGSNGSVYMHGCPNNITFTNCNISNSESNGVLIHDYYEATSNPTFTNCQFNNNLGVGIDAWQAVSLPSVIDCSFYNNGMYPMKLWASGTHLVSGTLDIDGNSPDGIYIYGNEVNTCTWPNWDVPYYVGGTITVNDGQTLTIEAGCEFKFTNTYEIYVMGCLIADGTPEEHIVFTSAQETPAAGDWSYLRFYQAEAGVLLDYCDLSYGGHSNTSLYIHGCPHEFTISNCTFSHSAADGIFLHDYYEAVSSPTISNCSFTDNAGYGLNAEYGASCPYITDCSFINNGSYAMKIWGSGVGRVTGSQTISGNNPNGILVMSGNVSTCTWYNYDVPYYLSESICVTDGETLTLEPGTELQFLSSYEFRVDGALIADGTPEDHIVFTSAQDPPAPGNWRYIYLYQADDGTIFDYCDISYGGSNNGMVYIHNGPNNFPMTNCNITHSGTTGVRISDYYTSWSYPTFENCVISDNNEYGVDCSSGGSNPFFIDCTITGNGYAPLYIWAYNIERVYSGNNLLNNGQNWIRVLSSDIANSTLRNHGIPYSFSGSCNLLDGGTVTIEPGTDLWFDDGTGFNVYGALIAEGSEENPITFTTSMTAPGPGGWRGLYFENCDSGTSLDYCEVTYGGDCSANIYVHNASNITIDNCIVTGGSQDGIYCSDYYSSPSTMVVSNTTVSDNAHYGINVTGGYSTISISDCAIQNNGQAPLLLYSNQIQGLVGSLTFGGNGEEWIVISTGDLYTNTWHDFGIPYRMTSSNSILANNTMTLDPGVALLFDNGARLSVYGALVANGTSSQHITFDSSSEEPSAGSWKNIYVLNSTSGCSFDYCDFANGGSSNALLELRGVGVSTVSNCTFTGSSNSGIMVNDYYTSASSVTISNCEIQNAASSGIIIQHTGTQFINNCYIHDCQNGLYSTHGTSHFTHGNVVTGNSEYGIRLVDNAGLLFGGDADHWNDIYGNGIYNFYNGNIDVDAPFVYWGTTDASAIEASIFHEPDNASLGLITFWPYMDQSHEHQYNQSLDTPLNVNIVTSGGSSTISWGAVSGATFYRVYSCDDPYADFSQWTLRQDNITTTYWIDQLTQTDQYYRVVACSE